MTLYISEIFKLVREAKNINEKRDILKKNDSKILRLCIEKLFNGKFLNQPKPKYEPDIAPMGLNPSHIFRMSRQFRLFEESESPLPPERRTRLLTGILSSMCAEESEVFLGIIRGEKVKLLRGVTIKSVNDVFDGLLNTDEPIISEEQLDADV